jgi:hypothetical protein
MKFKNKIDISFIMKKKARGLHDVHFIMSSNFNENVS